MEVILLERVAKLGQMGEVVRVKDGFGRNFLLPRGKALRATKENRTRFEGMKVELETKNLEAKGDAEKVAAKLNGKSFNVVRQASEAGQLFGSVSPRDLVGLLSEGGFSVSRSQIALNTPIKTIGKHTVPIALHPEIDVSVSVIVARSADEADTNRTWRGCHRAARGRPRRGSGGGRVGRRDVLRTGSRRGAPRSRRRRRRGCFGSARQKLTARRAPPVPFGQVMALNS